ncbi:MAG: DUF1549 domain-containing protein [Bryobacteraceae bacterium]|nr:DUF1549 domain-containing protein [Bryobacteraceae bacterium]
MLIRLKLIAPAILLASALVCAQETPEPSGDNCSFIAAPDQFVGGASRARRDAYERTLAFTRFSSKREAASRLAEPSAMPVKSFIDEEIFRKLSAEGVPSAAVASDEEFLRRVTLDLTGRIPSAAEIREFIANPSAGKRDALIDRLLYSPEFVDKWTMWLGDLLQNAAVAQNRSQQIEGRNRMHEWIKASIDGQKSFRDVAFEVITASGNNYDSDSAPSNFILRGFAPMGPAQDTADLLLVRSASMFLGLSHYDCLLCHDGKYHLDSVSAWGAKTTRLEAWRMAAHFSRVQMSRVTNNRQDYYFNSTLTTERATGNYSLNTTSGNRPRRDPVMIDGRQVANLTPVYRDGTPAAGGNWRESFARALTADPMFARNFVNRLWKAMFNLALAEPVDGLDPARLDPNVQPPAGWPHQASHPVLLEKLAQAARDNDFNLRETLRLIVSSTAYQLSSSYDGPWDMTKAPLFARHIPRRLEPEEVHDALVKASGVRASYRIGGWADPVEWAMQLPEPVEPRSNGTVAAFLNSFTRGNRDTIQRSQNGSILMWLNMMNSTVVTDRTRVQDNQGRYSPYLLQMARNTNNEQVVEDMFLTYLSRRPTEYEKGVALKTLAKATTPQYTRNAAVEDLAWALANKADFLFSY